MRSHITLFLLFCAAALADTEASFEGVVVDAVTHEPVRKAEVGLDGATNYWAVSAPDGHFLIEGVDPGTYSVNVTRQGYLDCDCVAGVKITTGQKVTGVQIKLSKYGAISGRVVDADGDPWPEGQIELFQLTWKHGKRTATGGTLSGYR